MTKRRYTLGQRAVSQEETRLRIVEATVALHQEIGPRDTTISAIAEKAQVQRLTVYRHFPNDAVLFAACSSHWFEQNPPPSLSEWNDHEGHKRIVVALQLLYSYYRQTERMWTLAYRDEPDVPAMRKPMDEFRNYLSSLLDDLVKHLKPKPAVKENVHLTLSHAIQFSTWQSLVKQQDDLEIAELVCVWLNGALDLNIYSNRIAKKKS